MGSKEGKLAFVRGLGSGWNGMGVIVKPNRLGLVPPLTTSKTEGQSSHICKSGVLLQLQRGAVNDQQSVGNTLGPQTKCQFCEGRVCFVCLYLRPKTMPDTPGTQEKFVA